MATGTPCPVVGSLEFVKGEAIDVGQTVASGKVVVLELWATWCPPCRDSVPHVTEMQHRHPEVVFIGVTTSDPPQKAKAFADKMGAQMDYRVACDTQGATDALQSQFSVQGIPHAFVISHENRITFSGHPMDPQFESAVASAKNAAQKAARRDLSGLSNDDLKAMPVKELKAILTEYRVTRTSIAECIEKQDLVDKVIALRDL